MKLLLDVGNTRIKWGIVADGLWLKEGAIATHEADQLESMVREWSDIQIVIGANVAGSALERRIEHALVQLGRIRWIRSTRYCCQVTNLYDHPEQLGVDRWAALIAARALHNGACLVVTAGTATTVDLLHEDGAFQGGLILPGDALMRSSLAERTAQLPLASGQFVMTPRNTVDAIVSGCLNAQAGAIERMFELIAGRVAPICVLNGGGAAALDGLLSVPTRRIENLVLKGLAVMAASEGFS